MLTGQAQLRLSESQLQVQEVRRTTSFSMTESRPKRLLRTWMASAIATSAWVLLMINLFAAKLPVLFRLHVLLLSPMLPLGAASVTAVRSRLVAPAGPKLSSQARKQRAKGYVFSHFVLAASALYAGVGGIAAIWMQKNAMQRAHLTSAHSRLGVCSLLLWLATYLVAQKEVWRDVIRQRRFVYSPRWLWGNKPHRRLGIAAYGVAMAAIFTGACGARGRGALALSDRSARVFGALLILTTALQLVPNARFVLKKVKRRR